MSCNRHKGYVRDKEMSSLCLFLVVLDNFDVLGDTCCVTAVGEHIEGEVYNVKCMETWYPNLNRFKTTNWIHLI